MVSFDGPSLDEIVRWKDEFTGEHNASVAEAAVARLEALPVNTAVLKATGIGKAVNGMAKRWVDHDVAVAATSWQLMFGESAQAGNRWSDSANRRIPAELEES